MSELAAATPGYDPAWALAGLIVVAALGVVLLVGWAWEFARKNSVFIVVFIIVVILFIVFHFAGLK